jgi:hypothetical protein
MHILRYALCLFLPGFPLVAFGSASQTAPSIDSVIGDPAHPADLPSAIANAYTSGARDITIAQGTYQIPNTGRSVIVLQHWKDATIHAHGVTIVFEGMNEIPFSLNDCENITVEGATLSYAKPWFTQGRIKEIVQDAGGKDIDWQIDAGYPIFDPAKCCFDVVDQHTRLLKPGTGDTGCQSAESIGPGLFRLHRVNGEPGAAAVNDWLFTRLDHGGNPTVHLNHCSHCTMREITLKNSGFAAFFETDGEGGHHYVDCHVVPGPKPVGATEPELAGGGADGFHSAGTRTGPTIEHCCWEGVFHDDCIAIHGSLQKIVRSEGNTLVLERGNRGGFAAGDPVRISSKDGCFGQFTCTSKRTVGNGDDELLELTLDRNSGAPADAKASNPRRNGAGYKILNCSLGNCRSRGILVKADNGLIEGCTISGCGMSAISIGPEYFWGEADYCSNVTVRGNILRNNVLNGSEAGAVYVHGDGAIGNQNITISNNLFDKNYGQIAIHAEYTDGILVSDNRFLRSPIPLPSKARTILDLTSTKNVVLTGNVVEIPPDDDVLVNIGKNVDGIKGNDSGGISAMPTR